MTAKLRVVAFTAGVSEIDRVFFERLAKDPLLDLVAIDEYAQPFRATVVVAAKRRLGAVAHRRHVHGL